jgi:hypothetical protein
MKVVIQCSNRVEGLKYANRKHLPLHIPKRFSFSAKSLYPDGLTSVQHEIAKVVQETTTLDLSLLKKNLDNASARIEKRL